jgi:hypothetical protein
MEGKVMKKEEANKILEEMLDSLLFKANDKRASEDRRKEMVKEKIKELEIFAREHKLTFTLPDGIYKDENYRFFDGTETVEEFLNEYEGTSEFHQIKELKGIAGTMFWYHSQYCSY